MISNGSNHIMEKFILIDEKCERIVRLPTVIVLTGECRAGIYAAIKAGRFPKQRKLGKNKRSVGWSFFEIQDYVRITLAGGEYFAV